MFAIRTIQKGSLPQRAFASNNMHFPRHKELFNEDYYEDKDNGTNPYNEEREDAISYDKPSHRATGSGILSTYKKQLNLSAEDITQKDFWTQMHDVRTETADRLKHTRKETFTKEYVQRLRL